MPTTLADPILPESPSSTSRPLPMLRPIEISRRLCEGTPDDPGVAPALVPSKGDD